MSDTMFKPLTIKHLTDWVEANVHKRGYVGGQLQNARDSIIMFIAEQTCPRMDDQTLTSVEACAIVVYTQYETVKQSPDEITQNWLTQMWAQNELDAVISSQIVRQLRQFYQGYMKPTKQL